MNKNDRPVNPTPIDGRDNSVVSIHYVKNSIGMTEGITLREQFAAMAMQGLLSQYKINSPVSQEIIAQFSVELADKLLNELAK